MEQMSRGSGRPVTEFRRMTAAEAVGVAFGGQARFTGHDRAMIALLAEHGVLTGPQLARLAGYASGSTARKRLKELHRLGVLDRFRRYQARGTQAFRYTLGPVGANLHAAATGEAPPTPTRLAERNLRRAESPRLEHDLAVAELFAALAAYAATRPGIYLTEWWSERRATDWCVNVVRPDAAAVWRENSREVAFYLELDRGTEPLGRVVGKLGGYRDLFDLDRARPVLFVLPSMVRERHLHAEPGLHPTGPDDELIVATTTDECLTTTGLSPADAVWLQPGARYRVRLVDLRWQR
jgi:hypothetical protein